MSLKIGNGSISGSYLPKFWHSIFVPFFLKITNISLTIWYPFILDSFTTATPGRYEYNTNDLINFFKCLSNTPRNKETKKLHPAMATEEFCPMLTILTRPTRVHSTHVCPRGWSIVLTLASRGRCWVARASVPVSPATDELGSHDLWEGPGRSLSQYPLSCTEIRTPKQRKFSTDALIFRHLYLINLQVTV